MCGVTRRAASSGSMFIVTGSTSTSTGRAPTSATTFAVDGNVYAGTSTSSPGPMPGCEHADVQRRGAGRDGDGVLRPGRVREQLLELLHLRPHRQLAALDHGRDLGELGLADVGQREPDYVSAGLRLRYHAIVLSSPSSSSTFASKPSCSRAFSTFGMRSSTSA